MVSNYTIVSRYTTKLLDSSRMNPVYVERIMVDAIETLYSIEDG
jgi:hypothetical protein